MSANVLNEISSCLKEITGSEKIPPFHLQVCLGACDYGLRFMVMVSEKAQYRYRALWFWEKYGLEATTEAFKVKRACSITGESS